MTRWDLTKKEATPLVECLEYFVLFLNICKLPRVTIVKGSHLNKKKYVFLKDIELIPWIYILTMF